MEEGGKRVESEITWCHRRIVQNSRSPCTSTRSSRRDTSILTENKPGSDEVLTIFLGYIPKLKPQLAVILKNDENDNLQVGIYPNDWELYLGEELDTPSLRFLCVHKETSMVVPTRTGVIKTGFHGIHHE